MAMAGVPSEVRRTAFDAAGSRVAVGRGRTGVTWCRCSGPKACGSISASGRMPVRASPAAVRAAELVQQLAAAAARHERSRPSPSTQVKAVSRPPPVALQRGDQAALGAQAEAVGGVLHVAAGDGAAVVDQGGGADRVAASTGRRPGTWRPGPPRAGRPSRRRPGGGHLPWPFRYGMPSALGIRSRCAESGEDQQRDDVRGGADELVGHRVGQQRTR